MHKEYEHVTAPPEKAIVSCSGTFTENNATYVENNLKEAGMNHDTCIQDTPDFMCQLHQLNQKEDLPDNAILVVRDAIGL